jgi:hypothetical protein
MFAGRHSPVFLFARRMGLGKVSFLSIDAGSRAASDEFSSIQPHLYFCSVRLLYGGHSVRNSTFEPRQQGLTLDYFVVTNIITECQVLRNVFFKSRPIIQSHVVLSSTTTTTLITALDCPTRTLCRPHFRHNTFNIFTLHKHYVNFVRGNPTSDL